MIPVGTSPTGVPVKVELGGDTLVVLEHAYRQDLKAETWSVRDNICREYWDVLLEDGSQVTLCRDLNYADRWYLHVG